MQERGTPAGNLKVRKANTIDANRPVTREAVFLCPKEVIRTTKIVDIDSLREHKFSEVMCWHCGYRWISVRPVGTLLKDLDCPKRQRQGSVFETGEEM